MNTRLTVNVTDRIRNIKEQNPLFTYYMVSTGVLIPFVCEGVHCLENPTTPPLQIKYTGQVNTILRMFNVDLTFA